mmetsp:Transcript_62549/g.161089  ORF Transcript_62549/g.161089 Transcript_62549/m.161089 type:complete len:237 (+) Transcript_62549:76-786(+)|eukprot:CAMPEP_0195059692 /NCGR_PEP_ID=MMETSP0448-20130528/7122_1 /TAXON_ID=66468 /ORGANISM="Heterocapsa triquestra, Strain CCMP 448" /LENGTH=236 /DNA_ID=CAMNT_0040090011 /DNA_START=76 /DNA_END=786 /DNA_ORIENTATION=+
MAVRARSLLRSLALSTALVALATCCGSSAFASPNKLASSEQHVLRGSAQAATPCSTRGAGAAEPQQSEARPMSWLAALGLMAAVFTSAVLPANADKRLVGEIPASGLIFKDTINIEEFDDPKVSGVNLYLSDFSRSFTDRLAKGDFFSDPGAAGLTCVQTGPVKVAADLKPNKQGDDVFNEARSILFKTLKVKRIYDAEGKNIIYVVFTERVDTGDDKNKSRFKSQLCAVHVDGVQ